MKWLLICLLLAVRVYAQEWQWAKKFDFQGIEGYSFIGGIDKDQNMYLTLQLYEYAPSGFKLLKINKLGELVWEKDIPQYFQGRIQTDGEGNTYLAFTNKVVCFDKDGNEIWKTVSNPSQTFGKPYLRDKYILLDGVESFGDSIKGFVTKCDYNGIHLNTVYYSLKTKSARSSIDYEDQVYIYDYADTDPLTNNQTALIKFDALGAQVDYKAVPHFPHKIINDRQGNTFLLGVSSKYHTPFTLDGKQYKYSGHFVIKYDPAGNLIWYKIVEGNLGYSDMAFDEQGNLFFTVDYSYSIKIGSDIDISTPAIGNLLMLKWDSGGKLLWQTNVPGKTGEDGQAAPQSIFVRGGDIFMSGKIKGSITFGNTSLQANKMYSELFVGRISPKNMVSIQETLISEPYWQIFPNPSGDVFTITSSQDEDLQISVTDVRGQVVKASIDKEKRKVDLSGLANGVYLLQIRSGGKTETKKLVKN